MAIANNDILIEAESGTGKELFAHAIHNSSERRNGPFIAINCAALTGSLLESELFGYEEGAFTGARKSGKVGLFELANKGTLFLDEVGEISNEIQTKLLRVLQEREIIRIGGIKFIPIDIRVIAATNRDLYELVKMKQFRADLYFRLSVFNLKIPPLRKRKGDIEFLIKNYLRDHQISEDFPQELMTTLKQYEWPGNIRELKNCMDYMTNIGENLTMENLPARIQEYCLEKTRFFESASDRLKAVGASNEIRSILEILQSHYRQQLHIGRKGLSQVLIKRGIFMTEQEVRAILIKLAEFEFVRINRGRSGVKITEKGEALLIDL